jgi:hypothetical protein
VPAALSADIGKPSSPAPRRAATPGRWWLLGFALIGLVTVARLPVVLDEVRSSVNARIASGDLPQTDQRSLAVSIGVSVALAVYLTVTLILVAVARRIEPSCRLPEVTFGRLRLPGMPYVVVGIALAVQACALVLQTTDPRDEVAVWAAAAAVPVIGVVAAARNGASAPSLLRLGACSMVVGLVCLVL